MTSPGDSSEVLPDQHPPLTTHHSSLTTHHWSLSDEPAWFQELLACPTCRHGPLEKRLRGRRCNSCGALFAEKDGIPCLVPPGWEGMVLKHERAWRFFENRLGTDTASVEDVLKLPAESSTRALLDWLRGLLRLRGRCRVLEIGAGRGWAARLLAEDGHQVVASDLRTDRNIGLGMARQQRVRSGSWFGCVVAAAEALPFQSESFDCIFCLSTLRHIADLERVLAEASRVLRPGGLFVALHEPYRGILTTQQQRLQGCASSMLARGWHSRMRADASTQALFKNAGLGSVLHEVCRRVPPCLDTLATAGLDGWVLPVPVALAAGPEQRSNRLPARDTPWLEPFVEAYSLDIEQLRKFVDPAGAGPGPSLLSQLLGHWLLAGNPDGILIAGKGRKPFSLPWNYPGPDPAQARRCELLLLACARRGFIPLHGFHPAESDSRGSYHWMQSQAGLLVASGQDVEITVAAPTRPWLTVPQRLEVRIEDEAFPRAVFAVWPGKTVSLRVPLTGADRARSSLLLRLAAGHDFVPSDQGSSTDTRLLAYQLRSIRAGAVDPDCLEQFLGGGQTGQAAPAIGEDSRLACLPESASSSFSCHGA
jgi:ubiquinone/menaquinone biosynthesis C-methylase UbiE/uncharacterized protein YbaR (Trm112 family)